MTSISNNGACTFPTCVPAAWGTLVHAAVLDASDLALFYGALTSPISVQPGDTPQVANQAFVIRLN